MLPRSEGKSETEFVNANSSGGRRLADLVEI
jgi:hypothetical protein